MSKKAKIQKTSKIIVIALRVIEIFSIVVWGLLLALFLWNITVRIDESFLNKLTFSNGTNSTNLNLLIIQGLIELGGVIVILFFIERVFRNIQNNGTPFLEKNPKRLKIVSIFLLCLSLLLPLIMAFLSLIVDGYFAFNLSTMSIFGIISAVILFALSLIFEYGFDLQKADDETL
ncbi:hypothetical protein FACS1894211_09990 [Clostridia bacterium]|nr:hypothetical protein FACS1894211_09990 [Clostridia bacterium]